MLLPSCCSSSCRAVVQALAESRFAPRQARSSMRVRGGRRLPSEDLHTVTGAALRGVVPWPTHPTTARRRLVRCPADPTMMSFRFRALLPLAAFALALNACGDGTGPGDALQVTLAAAVEGTP